MNWGLGAFISHLLGTASISGDRTADRPLPPVDSTITHGPGPECPGHADKAGAAGTWRQAVSTGVRPQTGPHRPGKLSNQKTPVCPDQTIERLSVPVSIAGVFQGTRTPRASHQCPRTISCPHRQRSLFRQSPCSTIETPAEQDRVSIHTLCRVESP